LESLRKNQHLRTRQVIQQLTVLVIAQVILLAIRHKILPAVNKLINQQQTQQQHFKSIAIKIKDREMNKENHKKMRILRTQKKIVILITKYKRRRQLLN
jgi:archaellum biogenesis protein FlaJ (TadC family)